VSRRWRAAGDTPNTCSPSRICASFNSHSHASTRVSSASSSPASRGGDTLNSSCSRCSAIVARIVLRSSFARRASTISAS
jgi:hypothetical protein